jgi:hypothetical protein
MSDERRRRQRERVPDHSLMPLLQHVALSWRVEFSSFERRKAWREFASGSGLALVGLFIAVLSGLSTKADWDEHPVVVVVLAVLPSSILVANILRRCWRAARRLYRERPHAGFRDPADAILVLISGWCFICGLCWYIEYQSVPHFDLEYHHFIIGNAIQADTPRPSTLVFSRWVTVENHGTPSRAIHWKATAKLVDGEILRGIPFNDGTFDDGDKHRVFPFPLSIFYKADQAVRRGSSEKGWAGFIFGSIADQNMRLPGTKIVMSCEDEQGGQYDVTLIVTGKEGNLDNDLYSP